MRSPMTDQGRDVTDEQDRTGDRDCHGNGSGRVLVALSVGLLALAVLDNLSAALEKMHPSGGHAGAVDAIANPFVSAGTARSLVASWTTWAEMVAELASGRPGGHALPGDLVLAWLLVDSFVLLPCVAFVLHRAAARRRPTRRHRLDRWLDAVRVGGAPAYVVAVLARDLAVWGEVFAGTPHAIVRLSSAAALATLIATVGPVAVAWIVGRAAAADRPPSLVLRLRVPLFALGATTWLLLYLPGIVRPQFEDVMRTLTLSDDRSALVAALAAVAVLGTALYASGRLAVDRALPSVERSPDRSPWRGRAAVVALGCTIWAAAASFTGWFVYTAHLCAALAVVNWAGSALWGRAARRADTAPGEQGGSAPSKRRSETTTRRWLATISTAPALVLSIALARSANLLGGWHLALATAAVPTLLAAAVWRWIVRRPTPRGRRRFAGPAALLAGTGLLAGAVVAAAGVAPLRAGWLVGTVGLLLAAITLVVAMLTGIEHLAWAPPTGLLRHLGLHRVPVLSLAVVVFVGAGALDSRSDFHAVRIEGTSSGTPRRGTSLAEVADELAAAPAPGSDAVATLRDGGVDVQPLFVIASSGGGARSAYWTSLVANCLFARQAPLASGLAPCTGDASWSSVGLASGISGGSIGLAMFDGVQSGDDPAALDVGAVFGDGFLDPAVAGLVGRDAVFGVWRDDAFDDRAAVMERAMEDRVPQLATGFFASQQAADGVKLPVLLLGSQSVLDGCRLNVSILDLSAEPPPASSSYLAPCTAATSGDGVTQTDDGLVLAGGRDLVDLVCEGQDLDLSTAALLSARFPFVSPSGALRRCGPGEQPNVFAVDGGYLDASASGTPLAVLPTLIGLLEDRLPGTCVQPVVIQVDNRYAGADGSTGTERPLELLAPLTAFGSAVGLVGDATREALELATRPRCWSGPGPSTYVHLYPETHPGVEAPLGWTLSGPARDDLATQLASSRNVRALCAAQRWLSSEQWWRAGGCAAGAPAVERAVAVGTTRLQTGRRVTAAAYPLVWIAVAAALSLRRLRRRG